MEDHRRSFTVERCLGRGGFGEVYLAEMSGRGGLSTSVALKVLRRDLAPDGAAIQRLRDEGRHLARLDHPSILRVHDLVVLDGRVALVTEYVAGEDLEGCLRSVDRIGARALVEVIGRIASALEAAWSAPLGEGGRPLRLAHRDIKPSNIRIGRYGEVKLLDFGIARSDEVTREARTQTDMMIGSPPYMAPERFLDNDVRLSSDLYSLGATLLEGLLGRRAFDLPVTMLAAHAVDASRYRAYVDARIAELSDPPAALVELVRALLQHDPSTRPAAPDLVRACEDLVDALPGLTLVEWCRAHPFTQTMVRGELDGRLVTAEGTFDLPAPPLPKVVTGSTLPRARGWLGVALGSLSVVSASAVVVLVLVVVAGLAAVRFGRLGTGSGDVPSPSTIAVPASPAPGPVAPAPGVVDPGAGLPEPVDPRPSGPTPRPPAPPPTRPTPVEASPAPPPVAPAPAAPPPVVRSLGRVGVSGEAESLTLVRGSTRVVAPAEVEAGAWSFTAVFPGGRTTSGTVQVPPGATVTLHCGARMGSCLTR